MVLIIVIIWLWNNEFKNQSESCFLIYNIFINDIII